MSPKRRVAFVLGCTGVGKTTVVRELLGSARVPLGRWTVGNGFAAAGPYTGAALDGPDSLPRSLTLVESMIDRLDVQLPGDLVVLLDGQRFGGWAMDRLRGRAWRIAVLLVAPVDVIASRRAARGSPEFARERLEAVTRYEDSVSRGCDVRRVVDAHRPLWQVVSDVRRAIA